MNKEYTDREFLLKIKEENKELWSALNDLAELYKENPIKAKNIIDQFVSLGTIK